MVSPINLRSALNIACTCVISALSSIIGRFLFFEPLGLPLPLFCFSAFFAVGVSGFAFGSVIMTLFILLGSFIFYNTNVLNKHWTNSETTAFRVGYEKALKKFEYIPQPKIVSVNLNVELYPSSRDYTAEGYYILKNTKEATINEVHIQKIIEDNVV